MNNLSSKLSLYDTLVFLAIGYCILLCITCICGCAIDCNNPTCRMHCLHSSVAIPLKVIVSYWLGLVFYRIIELICKFIHIIIANKHLINILKWYRRCFIKKNPLKINFLEFISYDKLKNTKLGPYEYFYSLIEEHGLISTVKILDAQISFLKAITLILIIILILIPTTGFRPLGIEDNQWWIIAVAFVSSFVATHVTMYNQNVYVTQYGLYLIEREKSDGK